MDSHGTDRLEEKASTETPEDVAVLYSWANLHNAKYRDFSASRREYRAQLRHRAAQQVREQALLAQAEAEAAATVAENAERQAVEVARVRKSTESDSSVQRALREAEEASRTAAAERVEAARRAEAAAIAEASARREEREIAEAHASAQRQAARYADSEIRRRATGQAVPVELPGEISDPYVLQSQLSSSPTPMDTTPSPQKVSAEESDFSTDRLSGDQAASATILPEQRVPVQQVAPRRPQGYRPDDASGVRQIYRGPDHEDMPQPEASRQFIPVQSRPQPSVPQPSVPVQSVPVQETKRPIESPLASSPAAAPRTPAPVELPLQQPRQGYTESQPRSRAESAAPASETWVAPPANERTRPSMETPSPATRDSIAESLLANASTPRQPSLRPTAASAETPRTVSPFSQALVPSDSTRGRRAQDDFDYQASKTQPDRRGQEPGLDVSFSGPGQRPSFAGDPTGPAWLYAPPTPLTQKSAPPVQSSVADTLQQSRERVAARWYALKGVFEQPGQERPEPAPIRQKEIRTPVLAVFSLAGGVGKTSLIATVGRALSSMGEKVLLADTTSHGLLPFYFGASELRQGTVRTFSPPSGSTDAPIYLVSHDIEQKGADEVAQEQFAEEIIGNSRGTQRLLLDFPVASTWIVRRLSRMNPTILVPVAPDMNSVISLQTVEKLFHGVNDGDGRPLQPHYVLNQFDASLPLHLDVREVLRRQLGDRLLPFVIRRAPAVSEALAEGMTVIDYAPDSPIAEDYMNVATWLRTVAAPATAGFRNVRWSER